MLLISTYFILFVLGITIPVEQKNGQVALAILAAFKPSIYF
ncbi:DNA-binding HTH domain-containing proteins [Moorella thermoacetica Y72]|uniref:DNA-binding HTH domain-containing proteins n=1 Tax=Moorella thermoacetica Y72 TaxID=1325331 RepID=A0A0S6U9R2_NEOTH|nr:DNA-binding HTH domain-containing proteins [Moorella thermoacetica Y72]